MTSRSLPFLLFIGVTILFSACKNEDDNPIPGLDQDYYALNGEVQEWLSSFGEAGQLFIYENDTGEQAQVEVTAHVFPLGNDGIPNAADCQRENGTSQCQYESVLLEFSSEGDTLMHLLIHTVAEDRLYLIPNRESSLVLGIAFFFENTEEFSIIQTDLFGGAYDAAFPIDGGTAEAITIENTGLEGLFAVPPKAFTLVKEVGITKWTDRQGRQWQLKE